jgi:hypothetical protein
LFCPTSSSHHKMKNVTNHHGNAKCPILHEHMALKRKNIDLSLNLFLTAALLDVLIQSNGSSKTCLWRESDGFENWKQQCRDMRVPRGSLHNPLTESAWQRLLYSGIDQSLIAMTGFDHRSFHHLLKICFYPCSIDTLHGQMAGRWVSAILRMIYQQKVVVGHVYWMHE